MANVLLGVTGSVAAVLTPALYAALESAGHRVKVVATAASLYFFDPAVPGVADPARPSRNPDVVVLDEDEWPGQGEGQRYQRGDRVLHIELRRWADALVLAPLDANTLAKLANGLADNCLTCVWRAWDRARPVVLAPAMNTFMWEHPATARHLRQVAADLGAAPPESLRLPDLVAWLNDQCPRLNVAPPQSKRLACDDVGVGALASLDAILAGLERVLAGYTPPVSAPPS
ncbi:MAG: phosphopantothenoylcysteine decarboxylase [Gemmataceae bacterium]|nr:phosphopantothenoylcysteine decarboxylase [Gemmataceae bacterium]